MKFFHAPSKTFFCTPKKYFLGIFSPAGLPFVHTKHENLPKECLKLTLRIYRGKVISPECIPPDVFSPEWLILIMECIPADSVRREVFGAFLAQSNANLRALNPTIRHAVLHCTFTVFAVSFEISTFTPRFHVC